MCLAIPARVLAVHGAEADIAVGGVQRTASLMLLEESVQPGDYVLLHAGFALRKWTAAEAQELEALLAQAAAPEPAP